MKNKDIIFFLNRIFFVLVIFIASNSCSFFSKYNRNELTDINNDVDQEWTGTATSENEIMKIFKTQKERVEKFQIKKISDNANSVSDTTTASTILPIDVKDNNKTQVSGAIVPLNIKKELNNISNTNSSEELLSDSSVSGNRPYATDYPNELIDINKNANQLWDNFTSVIIPREKIQFEVSYFGIGVGTLTLESKDDVIINDKKAYHYQGRLISSNYYKYIYSLNDTLDSYIAKDSFLPIKLVITQRESGQDIDDLQLFSQDEDKSYSFYKKVKNGSTKTSEKNLFIPRFFQDAFSSLYFVRGLPLKNNDHYEFPVVSREKIKLLKIDVVGREKIEVMDKEFDAIKISASAIMPGVIKDGEGGEIFFWYSDSKERLLLQFKAKVKFGSLSGELVKHNIKNLNDN